MTVVGSDSEQTRIWQDQDRVEYHLRQFQKPYRSTVHFADFIRRLGPGAGEALDVACGAGANICHLSATVPGFRWTGIDIAGDLLFPLGKPLLRAQGIEATLVDGDFYRLTETFTGKKFDLVLFMQTLYAIEEPDAAVEQLMAVTRGWLVISSLFSDLDVDVRMRAIDHQRPTNCQGPFIYNVFSLARFREFCETRGARDFVAEDFDIDIDLPQPTKYGLTTYTERLADGRRLQFTGPIFQPWKFVGLRMGPA
jgi:hypothetical protein